MCTTNSNVYGVYYLRKQDYLQRSINGSQPVRYWYSPILDPEAATVSKNTDGVVCMTSFPLSFSLALTRCILLPVIVYYRLSLSRNRLVPDDINAFNDTSCKLSLSSLFLQKARRYGPLNASQPSCRPSPC